MAYQVLGIPSTWYTQYLAYQVGGWGVRPAGKSFRSLCACVRCGCQVGIRRNRRAPGFPFSLLPWIYLGEAFPFPMRSKVKSKRTLCEILCELKINSKWKQCEILPPPPNPPIQLWLALSGIALHVLHIEYVWFEPNLVIEQPYTLSAPCRIWAKPRFRASLFHLLFHSNTFVFCHSLS